MKEESSEKLSTLKKLEVHTRILSRKITEYENDIKEKN
jgi:hypothetical protein